MPTEGAPEPSDCPECKREGSVQYNMNRDLVHCLDPNCDYEIPNSGYRHFGKEQGDVDLRTAFRELRSARATFVASKEQATAEYEKYLDMIIQTDAAMAELKLKAIDAGLSCIHNKGQKCPEPEVWLEGCGKCIIDQEVRAIENERMELAMKQADDVSFDQ